MSLRLAHPVDDDPEESVTVGEAARRLGCDDATVRALLRQGELGGHRVGKCAEPRGVRVHASTIRDYKRRHAIGAEAPAGGRDQRRSRPAASAGHAEARRWARANGMDV